MITQEEYQKALDIVNAYQKQQNEREGFVMDSSLRLQDINLSVRAYNVLNAILKKELSSQPDMNLKEQLEKVTLSKLDNVKFCGPKTIKEIVSVLSKYGIEVK